MSCRSGPCMIKEESGRITIMSIGFAMIALALVFVIVTASSVHIERKRLLALADATAAEAAEAIDLDQYYNADNNYDGVPVSDETVHQVVEERLSTSHQAERFDGLVITAPTGTEDGRMVAVTLQARARTVLVPWALLPWTDGIEIQVTAHGRSEWQ